MDIIHQRLLSATAAAPSSPLKRGQLFGESNIGPRNHEERKVSTPLLTASASDIDPQATDPQKDVMAEWRTDCGSDMGMSFQQRISLV